MGDTQPTLWELAHSEGASSSLVKMNEDLIFFQPCFLIDPSFAHALKRKEQFDRKHGYGKNHLRSGTTLRSLLPCDVKVYFVI